MITTHLIELAVLLVLCGLAWHDRPAREPIRLDDPRSKREERRQPNRSAS
jgi:hypothetical protein